MRTKYVIYQHMRDLLISLFFRGISMVRLENVTVEAKNHFGNAFFEKFFFKIIF